MASSLDKLIKGLPGKKGQQHGDGGAAPALPPWIVEGAALAYVSQSTGKKMDVFVEKIVTPKQQVIFSFAHDKKAVKGVTFAQILSGKSPLVPREAKQPVAKAKASSETKTEDGVEKKKEKGEGEGEGGDDDDPEKFLEALDKKFPDKQPERKSAVDLFGPTVNQVPKLWRQPEVCDIDSSPERQVVDLDGDDQDAGKESGRKRKHDNDERGSKRRKEQDDSGRGKKEDDDWRSRAKRREDEARKKGGRNRSRSGGRNRSRSRDRNRSRSRGRNRRSRSRRGR
eukprot:gnl/TRDRNA2_/TRDRNA2_126020_c0_seq1.p1 gnl/TRDRNA2_/TRDRNA2_126020_c0~~gnl/TRDRNA2_/TRDRNA2_126020_c0_seq1.p1  ORF type:complete len:283 (+),score=71.64 gnl/TRDRNA2_/TRDRNA2_126020_c0_seq1:98-946(+)